MRSAEVKADGKGSKTIPLEVKTFAEIVTCVKYDIEILTPIPFSAKN